MERWAANTLRTLGIILTSGFVVVGCLLLALLSMCAAGGGFSGNRDSNAAGGYALAAVLLGIGGIAFIAWLARGYRSIFESVPVSSAVSTSEVTAPVPEPTLSLSVHLSPSGRKAVDRLVLALAAQIVISAAAWIFNQLHFWSARRPYGPRNWTLALLAPYVLYRVPYAILIFALLKKPDRRAFAYSLSVPAVMILQAVFSLGVVGYFFVREPRGFLLLVLPWLIHILILVLAYQAIQQVGLHPEPSSLIVAAVVTFVYFSFIHVATPFLYRFNLRR